MRRTGCCHPYLRPYLLVASCNSSVIERGGDRWVPECSACDDHATTAVCWLSIAAIFRQPSILRNLICPVATRLKSSTTAASSLGIEPCVFTRRRTPRGAAQSCLSFATSSTALSERQRL